MVLAFIFTHQPPPPLPPIRGRGEKHDKWTIYGTTAFLVTLIGPTLTAYPRDTYHDFCWVVVLKRFVWLQRAQYFLQIDPKSIQSNLAPETLKQGFSEIHKENPDFRQFGFFFTYFTTPRKLSGRSTSNFLETCKLSVPNYCENLSH